MTWLKNPLTGALCKTRQENAEVYRHFAENLYSRTEAIPIDQGITDGMPVSQLLAAVIVIGPAEPDEPELWKVLKNRKPESAAARRGVTPRSLTSTRLCVLRWRVDPVDSEA